MKDVTFFESINISTPVNRIYTRLGYREGLTHLGDQQKKQVEESIEKALSLIQLKGAGSIYQIENNDSNQIVLAEKVIFKSTKLAKFLKGSSESLIMAVTAGQDIVDAIVENSSSDNLTLGVVLDAVASEMTDAGLQWIMNYFATSLKRERKTITQKRFSAGYGDFDIINQKAIYDLLQLERLGVILTSSYILVPEKSVTAVAGIITLE